MSTIKTKAQNTLDNATEVTTNVLPELKKELIVVDDMHRNHKKAIDMLLTEIDLSNTQSIIEFGSSAQKELQTISQEMLTGVRNKETGPAGDALREMIISIRGFSVDELNPNRQLSWWERFIGRVSPIAKFVAQYETVQKQIDTLTDSLLEHEHILLKDIKSLDKLYGKTLAFYDELAFYIAAGEQKISMLDSQNIPMKERQVEKSKKNQEVIKAQELRDLRGARDDLERRVHDLKLTRQVTMQSLPSIRLVQENDKSLVTKINSTLVNTVPLWETQLAQAVTIHRSQQASEVVKEATDLTNKLLESNAKNLKTANRKVRQQMERGVFDIESIKRANQYLIDTIEESLSIASEGQSRRAAAELELQDLSEKLKTVLAAAPKINETHHHTNIGTGR